MTADAPAAAVPVLRIAVRLRLSLLRGALRSRPGGAARQVGLVLGAVFAAALALGAFVALAAARGSSAAPDLAALLFTGLLAAWVVLPVLTFGSDDLLDPSRLALLPLNRRQLLGLLGVGALVGVAPVATGLAALGLVPATAHGPVSLVVALVAAVLELLLCVAVSRACAAALSGLLRSRRGRDLGVLLTALVVVSFQLGNVLLQSATRHGGVGSQALHSLAGPLRWTPPGLLAAAPTLPPAAGAARLLAVAGVLALVTYAWERSVRRALERPDSSGGRRRRTTSLVPRGLGRVLPSGRLGAVAAKDLRYLTREPRRLVALVTSTLVPVVAVGAGPLVLSGRPPPAGLVFVACGPAVLVGLASANRFGMDGTAIWQLIASATDRAAARCDLLGGDLAATLVGAPLVVAVAAGAAGLAGPRHLVAALGLAIALLAISTALSGLVAVLAPYAVPDSVNAFSSGSTGQGCAAGLLALGSVLGTAVLALPLLALLVPALHHPGRGPLLLLAGPVYGLALGAGLRELAARRWAQRGPEVLQVLATTRS